MTDTKSEARFSLDDVIVIRTPNDCKMCERRVNTYVENVKDWQRQYDEILAKHERVLQALEIAKKTLLAISLPITETINTTEVERLQTEAALEALAQIESLK